MGDRSPSPRPRPRRQPAGNSRQDLLERKGGEQQLHDVEVAAVDDGSKDDSHLGLAGDYFNLLLLLLLYTLQGIPMGLAGSIPYILAEKGTGYSDQAQFSFVSWPFSLKLFWAPIVDSVYSESFGRRKTWLVPAQFAIAFLMLVGGQHADALLAEGDDSKPADVPKLTALFFSLFFLAATQDIAVDGWALTMLARRNIGHASTTNAVGQSFGVAISFSGFLALKAKGFCTLGGFMSGWSIVYFVTTLVVWVAKKENPTPLDETPESAIIVYKQMWDVLNLSAVKRLLLIMFTWKIGFAAGDAIAALKLMEHGMPKEHMATVSMAMTPVMMILPMVVASPTFEQYTGLSTAGKRPLSLIAMVYKPRLAMGVASAFFVHHVADLFPLPEGADVPYTAYVVLLLLSLIGAVFMTMMFVAQMAFFARVADPAIGGTYMTLLNTITNLGGNWPSTVALALVDPLTTRSCLLGDGGKVVADGNAESSQKEIEGLHNCNTNTSDTTPPFQAQTCIEAAGHCVTTTDGYYTLSAFCFVFGVCWIYYFTAEMAALEKLPSGEGSVWRVRTASDRLTVAKKTTGKKG